MLIKINSPGELKKDAQLVVMCRNLDQWGVGHYSCIKFNYYY